MAIKEIAENHPRKSYDVVARNLVTYPPGHIVHAGVEFKYFEIQREARKNIRDGLQVNEWEKQYCSRGGHDRKISEAFDKPQSLD